MQPKKVRILRDPYAAFLSRSLQVLLILSRLSPQLLNSHRIHAAPAKSLSDGFGHMLVHVKPDPLGHRSCRSAWT